MEQWKWCNVRPVTADRQRWVWLLRLPCGPHNTLTCSLFLSQPRYHVLDKFAGHSAENYTYYFNVCGNVNPPGAGPQKNGDACQTTVGSDGVAASGPAPAFQVANWENRCYRLANADEGPVFGLIGAVTATLRPRLTILAHACLLCRGCEPKLRRDIDVPRR